ncbi:MAG: cytochrome c family protein [Saprospiraceae bacterium]|nr:cytochrome c family protein [Saprospiraceae bacterium]
MKTKSANLILTAVIALAFSCNQVKNPTEKMLSTASVQSPPPCNCYSISSLYNIPIYFNDQVPGDLQSFNNQSQVNCFAWQEFISLNWPVNPADSFGTPKNLSPVQWETYMPREVLFQPDGVAPPPWGTLVSDEYSDLFKSQKLVFHQSNTKLLTFTSKVNSTDTLIDLTVNQAAPQGKPNWLGAQNSTNVWYEIMLNEDYYNFVVQNGYYNAKTQHDSVKAGIPINFPQGQYQGAVGAIELKAAWMEVPNPAEARWSRYKLSTATVLDPGSKTLRTTTVALVGLHILHKTHNQPTWVWATFEQIDNVPGRAGTPPPPYGYNFYNSNCTARNVQIKTTGGDSTVTVTCNANTSPPYYLMQATPVPVQITRVNPIDSIDAAPINTMMQNNIRQYYPNAVWQYYQLVDVIWSQSLQPDPTTPIQAPRNLNLSSMTSGVPIVANTTLESYVQKTNTCISCHVYSTIAPFPPDSFNNNIFGDFSFAITFAKYNKGLYRIPVQNPLRKKLQ